MQKKYDKYFWDGKSGWSDSFILQRIIEYATFEDLVQYPYNEVKMHINALQLDKIRTGSRRKQFIIYLKPYILVSNSWEEAIEKMLDDAIKKNAGKIFTYNANG